MEKKLDTRSGLHILRLDIVGFPGDSRSKESACNGGDPGSIPGSGSSLGEGNGYPLQPSCLENPMDREAWRATVHGVTKELDTTERLRLFHLQYGGQLFLSEVLPTPHPGVTKRPHVKSCLRWLFSLLLRGPPVAQEWL